LRHRTLAGLAVVLTPLLTLFAPMGVTAAGRVSPPSVRSIPGVATTLPPPAPAPSALVWKACSQDRTLDCGSVTVPLDYSKPTGRQIDIAVLRVRARRTSERIGTLLWSGSIRVEHVVQARLTVSPMRNWTDILRSTRYPTTRRNWPFWSGLRRTLRTDVPARLALIDLLTSGRSTQPVTWIKSGALLARRRSRCSASLTGRGVVPESCPRLRARWSARRPGLERRSVPAAGSRV
jgi:hypothetical protein